MIIHSTYKTLAEAAITLRCSKRTLLRWIKDGKLSFVRLGRQYLFRESDLLNIEASRLSTVEEIIK